jgi:hypothetical protein
MRLDKLLGARHDWLRRDALELFVCLGCKRKVTDKELLEMDELRKQTAKNMDRFGQTPSWRLGPFWSDCPANPRKPEELEGRMINFE